MRGISSHAHFLETIAHFQTELPYRVSPYSKRNWGHPWHSLCSYHGKLKPSIAHFLVSLFSDPGDVVLDPLCGVGTIPLEACLQGRNGFGNDLNPMAYSVTLAKVGKPDPAGVSEILHRLESWVEQNPVVEDPYPNFGFNGHLKDYFHPKTYTEILSARSYFSTFPVATSDDALVHASLLHILHGNRPYALSRNSHPLTPYAPTGPSEYRPLMVRLRKKVTQSLQGYTRGQRPPGRALLGDFRRIEAALGPGSVDVIITSPPFMGSLRFYLHNWMRLWFAGWEPETFRVAEVSFLEAQQRRSLDVYQEFFAICHNLLKPNGRAVLHLGKSAACDMAVELGRRAHPCFNLVETVEENVEELEKHGIRDKGGTTAHQFLFLEKV